MRYIGNKENLVEWIFNSMCQRGVTGKSIFDFFSGTTSVAKFFKKQNYQVITSDLMYFSFVLQKTYIENNNIPKFKNLGNILDKTNLDGLFITPLQKVLYYLSNIKNKEGFIYHNYTLDGTSDLTQPRMFYTGENGKFIDKVRLQIEDWHNKNLLTESEYFILLASLIETVPFYANISGVYAAFQKKWDPRALKPMKLRDLELISNKKKNMCFLSDSLSLLDKVEADIFYLDPPYNQRQYAPNYHLLETIAKYDNPTIKGVAGLRDYSMQKSSFCNAQKALQDLDKIVNNGHYKYIVMSYNNEGIMPHEQIIEVLKNKGRSVEVVNLDYLRFKSNNKGPNYQKKYVKEKLYIVG